MEADFRWGARGIDWSAGSGAIEPEILYVGTGDVTDVGSSVNQGDGMYKSTDGGLTWRHVGLDDTRHIGTIWVGPRDPDIVVVAALNAELAGLHLEPVAVPAALDPPGCGN